MRTTTDHTSEKPKRGQAIVGISALRPDLVILDEFQRFKDLLQPDPDNFAAELAHRLFDYIDPGTGRPVSSRPPVERGKLSYQEP